MNWTREEYKKIGAKYGFLRSCRENNWYPLRRFVPAPHPCARGNPQNQAPEEEQATSFWDVEL